MAIRIPPAFGEDYEFQWGKVDYRNKTVLDIGSDYGSTADYFLRKGATLVICVDCNEEYINRLKQFISQYNESRMIPVLCYVNNKEQWRQFILTYNPDVVKADCEGCERSLFDLEKEYFRMVPEYIIECHGDNIELFQNKCNECGYDIVNINPWAGRAATIIYARRRD